MAAYQDGYDGLPNLPFCWPYLGTLASTMMSMTLCVLVHQLYLLIKPFCYIVLFKLFKLYIWKWYLNIFAVYPDSPLFC